MAQPLSTICPLTYIEPRPPSKTSKQPTTPLYTIKLNLVIVRVLKDKSHWIFFPTNQFYQNYAILHYSTGRSLWKILLSPPFGESWLVRKVICGSREVLLGRRRIMWRMALGVCHESFDKSKTVGSLMVGSVQFNCREVHLVRTSIFHLEYVSVLILSLSMTSLNASIFKSFFTYKKKMSFFFKTLVSHTLHACLFLWLVL